MPTSAKYLIVGSTEPHSGKTSTLLGLARQLQESGVQLAIGQPLATGSSKSPLGQSMAIEGEVPFVAEQLGLSGDRVQTSFITVTEDTLQKRMSGEDSTDYQAQLAQLQPADDVDLVLWEGPSSLCEGSAFDLSLPQMAKAIDAQVLLVARYNSSLMVERLLEAQTQLGDRAMGVILNNVPAEAIDTVRSQVQPFLERCGLPVLGLLPYSALLRSVSVAEVVKHLGAEVLCGQERLDLMVESLQIGAMSVNSAVKYFQQSHNTAIVTGGDRTDIQLAALETATHCLILTGHRLQPSELVLNRAEEVEIPVISVERDTLTTVEMLDMMFGRTAVREPLKLDYIYQMAGEHLEIDRFLEMLDLVASRR